MMENEENNDLKNKVKIITKEHFDKSGKSIDEIIKESVSREARNTNFNNQNTSADLRTAY